MPWTKRSEIMLFYPFEEKRLAKWKPPYLVQPKLDGVRCRAEIDFISLSLISSELNEFPFLKHIKEELIKLNYVSIELDGELYCHGWNFWDIHSVASRKVNPHPNEEFLQYHIFDYASEEPQIIRTDRLNEFPEGKYVKIVPTYVAENFEEIYSFLGQFISEGYEGIIVREMNAPYIRRRSTFGMKWKPKRRDDYMIKGYSISVDKYGETKEGVLGRLICSDDENLPFIGEYPPKIDPPEDYFAVGSGFTDLQRVEWWKRRSELVGRIVTVEYQHLTKKNGVPRFGVFSALI